MFESGKKYKFHMFIDGDETTFWDIVEIYEHPLIKLADVDEDTINIRLQGLSPDGSIESSEDFPPVKTPFRPGMIINVTSPAFISAEMVI